MGNTAEIVLGTNIDFVTIDLHTKYGRNRIRFVTQASPRTALHSHSPPQAQASKQSQAATDNHKQPQTVTCRRRQPQTATDPRQLALLFSYSINFEYDSRHGLLLHLLRQNNSDTHMGCATLNNFNSPVEIATNATKNVKQFVKTAEKWFQQ